MARFKQKYFTRFYQELTSEEFDRMIDSYLYKTDDCTDYYELYDKLFNIQWIHNDQALNYGLRIYLVNQPGKIQTTIILDNINLSLGQYLKSLLP